MSGAKAVREDRLWQRHADMAKLGGTPKGGVNRQALSPEDAAARNLLASWAKARGFSIFTDAIGNLFVRREGSDAKALPVMSGSHMDSQPTGGRFDGMYGVLAAFEALEALEDAGIRTQRPVIAVAWTNEEGSRFQPGAMGSAVFTRPDRLGDALQVKDWDGVVLKDALADTLKAAPAPMHEGPPGFPVDSYVEAHIEQGPRLENEGKTIGVVTAIQGSRRYIVEIDGEEAHAGTTPRAARKDAFAAATRIAAAMYEATTDGDDTLRFTIGRVEVHPGSPNTVPGKATFTIDMRHPRDAVLEAHEKKLLDIVASKAAPCPAHMKRVSAMAPTDFDPKVIDLVRAKADAQGLSNMDMPSGAGHDAMHIARLCPAGMIFVPCERGISHNEIENATPGDLAAGARVLVAVLEELANG
jgi:beta-ureidopropionase / N-carbamoyl-L-amino-acid hydrolase